MNRKAIFVGRENQRTVDGECDTAALTMRVDLKCDDCGTKSHFDINGVVFDSDRTQLHLLCLHPVGWTSPNKDEDYCPRCSEAREVVK